MSQGDVAKALSVRRTDTGKWRWKRFKKSIIIDYQKNN